MFNRSPVSSTFLFYIVHVDQTDFLLSIFTHKKGLKSALLERKLSFLEKETEQRESLLGEVLKISNIEPTAMSTRIEKLLAQKNEKIGDLRYELARLSKAHDDMLEVFKAKMIKYGIPIEELGPSLPMNFPKKTAPSRGKR